MRLTARHLVGLLIIGLVIIATVIPTQAQNTRPEQEAELYRYALATWRSFDAMTVPATGLTADNINAVTRERARYTSPTNIATYIWSTIAARDLGIITATDARHRIARTLQTLSTMERHQGQFFNWYDPATGAKLDRWPVDNSRVWPFLSSVDNGWLAAALMMIPNAIAPLADEANAIVVDMNFAFYYDPTAGLLRGGYWTETPEGGVSTPVVGPTDCKPRAVGDPPFPGWTCHHYGSFNTEPRIASYIGIGLGDIPPEHYFKMWRTFPATCDWGWHEMRPGGEYRTYMGVEVFEGHYTYRKMNIVPSWGGSMFEALMVPLLAPEAEWGPKSWGINHPLYVQAQIEHGLIEAQYGYWGFSPSNDPAGGYREYGVDAIGLNPDGYTSNQERTLSDYGFPGCGRETKNVPPASAYTNGVVTPHASFLALDYAQTAALTNLRRLRANFDAYSWGGFYDAINVDSGQVSKYYLALDQGMIMVAIANALMDGHMRSYFAPEIEERVRPLMAMEEFTAGRTCVLAFNDPQQCAASRFTYFPLIRSSD